MLGGVAPVAVREWPVLDVVFAHGLDGDAASPGWGRPLGCSGRAIQINLTVRIPVGDLMCKRSGERTLADP